MEKTGDGFQIPPFPHLSLQNETHIWVLWDPWTTWKLSKEAGPLKFAALGLWHSNKTKQKTAIKNERGITIVKQLYSNKDVKKKNERGIEKPAPWTAWTVKEQDFWLRSAQELSLRMSCVHWTHIGEQALPRSSEGEGGSLFFFTLLCLQLRVGRKMGEQLSPLTLHLGRWLAPLLNGSPSLKLGDGAATALEVFN